MNKYLLISVCITLLACAGTTDKPIENDLYRPYIPGRENSLFDMNHISHLFDRGDSVQLYSLFDTLYIINCELYTKIPGYISGIYLSFNIENDSTLITIIMVDRDLNFVNLFLNATLPAGKYIIRDVPNRDYNGNSLSWVYLDDYLQYIRKEQDYGIYMIWPSWIMKYMD